MTKRQIDVDNEALAGAAEFYETETDEQTVNAALREASARQRRRKAWERLAELGESGMFDELLDKRNRR